MRKVLYLFLIMAVVMMLGGQALAQTYVVGTSADFPPFEYMEDGEFVGFDMDLMRAIAEEMDFEIEFRDISFDSLIPGLRTGTIDIVIAAMTITEERARAVDFSDPYYVANQSIIVRKDSGFNLTVLFGDNRIGAQTGTTGDLWVTEELYDEGILTGRVVRYETFDLAIEDLVNENVEALVLDRPVAERFVEARPLVLVGEIITHEEYGIAVDRGNEELLAKINEGLEKVVDSGRMGELIDKYFE